MKDPTSRMDYNDAAANVVGVDVGGTKIAAGLVTYTDGDAPAVSCFHTIHTVTEDGGQAVMGRILNIIHQVLAESGANITGIGLGTTGSVCPSDGSIASSNGVMQGWTGMPIKKNLEHEFKVPASVIGDVQAHALGESRWGAARGCSSCLLVAAGTGLGGGIVIGGRLLVGAHGVAGHIGHTLHPLAKDRVCACGQTGHAESITCGRAIAELYQGCSSDSPRFDPSITGEEVSRRGADGETHARETLQQAGRALGQAIGSWANTIDPEIIVLGGSVSQAGEVWRKAVDEGFAQQALEPIEHTRIVSSSLGGGAAIIGAAEALRDMLKEGKHLQ